MRPGFKILPAKPNQASLNLSILVDKVLGLEDLNTMTESTTSVKIQNCQSSDWNSIGKRLLSLPKISELEVRDCLTGNVLC